MPASGTERRRDRSPAGPSASGTDLGRPSPGRLLSGAAAGVFSCGIAGALA